MGHLSLNRIRELTSSRIGLLTRISGQVVRTHPVHPELVSGTFLCLDCQTVIKDVEQQFKYTQPNICRNPVCANRKRFLLDTNKSRFVDFQKVIIKFLLSSDLAYANNSLLGTCNYYLKAYLDSVKLGFYFKSRIIKCDHRYKPKTLNANFGYQFINVF